MILTSVAPPYDTQSGAPIKACFAQEIVEAGFIQARLD